MKARILVADDDLELCQVIADTLNEQGYEASFVMTAEEALEKAVASPPALILMDLEIPQMGGFVLCQKVRENESTKNTPILFLTVRDSDFDRRTAMSLGANGYVTKPFRRSVLLKEVENLLPAGAARKRPINERILVVDDDVELCNAVVDTLKDYGYKASFINNAEDGLREVLANPPNLVLLDMEVPEMGGLVFCQKLRANPKGKAVPVMFVTGRTSEFDRRAAMSLGANHYITKPFKRGQLLQEIDALLSSPNGGDMVGPSASHVKKIGAEPAKAAPGPAEAPAKTVSPAMPAARSGVEAPAKPSAPSPSFAPSRPAAAKSTAAVVDRIQKSKVLQLSKEAGAGIGKKLYGLYLKNKFLGLGVAFALILALMWGSVGLYRKLTDLKKKVAEVTQEQAGEVAVNVMQVAPAPFQDILSAVGTIAGGSEIELRFQTEGNIRALNFREGDKVRSGQVIAQLDQSQTLIKLERARSEFYRYEKLYALGGVSKDRLEEARIQYDYAQTELDKTVLRATQEGILGDKGVEVGEFVTPQKKVGTLVSLNTVLVRIGVIEKEIDKIYPGQQVLLTVDTYPNMEFKGKVENISPLVQGQSKTLMVEARIPNEGKLLLPGMFARSKIVIFEKDGVIAVPNDALEKTAQGYSLFVVGAENKAENRPVEVSYVSLSHSVISNGLQPGEQVIIQKPQELKAGAPVKVVEVEKGAGGEAEEMGAEQGAFQ